MVAITRAKARLFYDQYKQITILPVGISPLNCGTFRPLTIKKEHPYQQFPMGIIHAYHRAYSELGHSQLCYYITPTQVLIQRNGQLGFNLLDPSSKQIVNYVKGSDATLVNYINANCLDVVNKGYLLPRYHKKISIKTVTH